METAKYIINFFFGPGCGWHFIGLCVVCLCLSPKHSTETIVRLLKKEDEK